MHRSVYLLSFIALSVLLLKSCGFKEEDCWEQEKRPLEQYLRTKNITVQPTSSGLYYIPVEEGPGLEPLYNALVEFEYTGKLIDGTIFGTTYDSVGSEAGFDDPGIVYGPVRMVVGTTIPGLAEGFQLMKEGGKAMFIIPSDLAYGRNSIGAIPSCATLIFTIDLQRIIPDAYEDEKNKIADFLVANDYHVTPTESGLYYIEHVAGTGDLISYGDHVFLYYKGYFLDGRVFDSNYGEDPFGFRVTNENIIEGWNEGVQLMKKGSKGTLIVPFDLAYGATGSSNISPYMTLVFDMEIADVD